ncbi:hypothetical protein C1H46_029674 [Malus baccata]|uniref:Uncharacterized protein n=1 Tax=Malus baccata TaxID=106549 RepID=A0A540LE49_MALBA|nr:hypothetical protein C1H46_029674 [Malus baccata]
MAWMYGRFGPSDSTSSRPFPTNLSISSLALLSTFGWLMSSASAHSTEMAVVSVSAVKKS